MCSFMSIVTLVATILMLRGNISLASAFSRRTVCYPKSKADNRNITIRPAPFSFYSCHRDIIKNILPVGFWLYGSNKDTKYVGIGAGRVRENRADRSHSETCFFWGGDMEIFNKPEYGEGIEAL